MACLVQVILLVVSMTVVAEPSVPYRKFRFDEDYGHLQGAGSAASALDAVKFIPLERTKDTYVSLGGSVRERYEYTGNPLFGDERQDERGVWLQRASAHADLHIGRQFRAFFELTSALEKGREGGPSPVDENRLDVQNAFVDVLFAPSQLSTGRLRLGRQEVQFGSGRLVDVREGTNVRRTFDGVRGFLQYPDWELVAILAQPRRDEPGVFDDGTNDDETLWGVYGSTRSFVELLGDVDVYYLGFRDERGAFVQGTGDEERHTLGLRVSKSTPSWDWNVEGAYQFGSFGAGDISAWTIASDIGVTFVDTPLSPRLGLRANIASGDDDATDPDLETFNPLFPRGNYFSAAAVLGPRNFFNLNPHLTVHISEDVSVSTNVNFFWRLEKTDGVYSPAGQIIRAPAPGAGRYVATSFSVELAWELSRHFDATATYARLEPGSFIRDTGEDDAIDFIELTVRFRF
ncbi:MAG: alginate export family protein [Pseudomonadota bacterium]